MSDVYVIKKCYPYEGSSIMGIYSSMENAKEAINPYIENENLLQYLCASFYRWKNLYLMMMTVYMVLLFTN